MSANARHPCGPPGFEALAAHFRSGLATPQAILDSFFRASWSSGLITVW